MTQLSLEQDSLVGNSWWHEQHGRTEVIAVSRHFPGWYRLQVRGLDGHRRFQMEMPDSLVRSFLPKPEDEWLPLPGSDGRDFYNATRHRALVRLGLVPPMPDPATAASCPAGQLSEARPSEAGAQTTRRLEMSAVTERPRARRARTKKTGSKFDGMSKTALRKLLLEKVTLSDAVWKSYRVEHGLPDREPGETREAFIRRALA